MNAKTFIVTVHGLGTGSFFGRFGRKRCLSPSCTTYARQIFILITLGPFLVNLVGCGGPTDKSMVSGKVTFNGKPIDDGMIWFRPVDGTEGPVTGAMIVNGMYKVKNKGGVTTGTNRVEIEGYRPMQGGKKVPEIPGMDPNPRDQYVPKKFNTKSEFRITIESGQGNVTKNFELIGGRP